MLLGKRFSFPCFYSHISRSTSNQHVFRQGEKLFAWRTYACLCSVCVSKSSLTLREWQEWAFVDCENSQRLPQPLSVPYDHQQCPASTKQQRSLLNFPTALGCEIVRKRFQVGADPLSGIKFGHRVLDPLFFFFFGHVKSSENWKLIYYHVVINTTTKEVTGLPLNFCHRLQAVLC